MIKRQATLGNWDLGDGLKETCNLKGTTYHICGMQTSGVSTKFEAC